MKMFSNIIQVFLFFSFLFLPFFWYNYFTVTVHLFFLLLFVGLNLFKSFVFFFYSLTIYYLCCFFVLIFYKNSNSLLRPLGQLTRLLDLAKFPFSNGFHRNDLWNIIFPLPFQCLNVFGEGGRGRGAGGELEG